MEDLDLSQSEKEILNLLVTGKSNVQIAKILNFSPDTIKVKVSKIYRKLNTQNRVQTVAKALMKNIV